MEHITSEQQNASNGLFRRSQSQSRIQRLKQIQARENAHDSLVSKYQKALKQIQPKGLSQSFNKLPELPSDIQQTRKTIIQTPNNKAFPLRRGSQQREKLNHHQQYKHSYIKTANSIPSPNKTFAQAISPKQIVSSKRPITTSSFASSQSFDRASQFTVDSKASSAYIPDQNENLWASIMRYNALMEKIDHCKQKKQKVQQMEAIKGELERQILEQVARRQNYQAENQQFHNKLIEQIQTQERKEKERANAVKLRLEQEKRERDQQMADIKNRRKQITLEEQQIDRQHKELAKQAALEEQRAFNEKKNAAKDYAKQLQEEHARNVRLKQASIQQQREQDIKDSEEYGKLLQGLEENRLRELRKIERKQQLMVFRNQEAIKNLGQMKSKKDQLYNRQVEADMADIGGQWGVEKDQSQKTQLASFLNLQMKDKEQKRREELDWKLEQARIWDEENSKYHARQTEKDKINQQLRLANAQFLRNQIQSRQAKKRSPMQMSEAEILLNKKLLKQIKRFNYTRSCNQHQNPPLF